MKLRNLAGSALFMCCAVTSSRADYASSVLALNPLGYWRFNEPASSPALNSVANSSPLGHALDGYAVLDVVKGEPGRIGSCVRLTNPVGTTHCGSKVDIPFNKALNPQPPFSIEFWAKANSLSGGDATGLCPLSNFNPNWFNGGNRSGWLFYVSPAGRWQFRLGATSGYAGVCTATSGNATPGTWQHIVATYDGVTANLYADGALIGTAPAPVASWTANSQMALRIGGTPLTGDLSDGPTISASGISGNRGWDGWIDELAIYPTVLSPSAIAAHHDAATTNNAAYGAQILADGPVGYWNLDEPAVTPPDPSTFPTATNSGSLGNVANGTVIWGALTGQAGSGYAGLGAGNQALFFDGENGSVEIADAPGLHFTGQITLMAWVKPRSEDFFRDVIAHGWDNGFAETFLRISRGGGPTGYGDDNSNYYEVGTTDGATFYDNAQIQIPPGDIGNWVFLAGTYDGANWNLYRDGVLVSSLSSANGAQDVTNIWTIGSRGAPSATAPAGVDPNLAFAAEGLFFGGAIDEPAIFNTALSASAIAALYNAAQVPPVITQAPQNPGTVFKGDSVSLSVLADGNPPLTYLWLSNSVSTGVTANNITLNNLQVGNQTIAAVVTNPYGSATSSVTFAVVAAPPSFVQQPLPATRYTGLPFTFSVVAAGTTPLTYQWKLNNTQIPGATSSSYSGTAGDSTKGDYVCTLSNEVAQLDSNPATLTVLPIPSGYASAVIGDSPKAFWRLGESGGTVAHDYYGGFDGTYNSATLGLPGYSAIDPDTAVAFDGPNSYVGGIDGSSSTGIYFSGHTSFTLEAWVNAPPGQSDEATIIAKGIGATGTTRTEQFSLDVVGGLYRFFTTGNQNALYEADATVGPNNTWQYVVGVYDDAGATMYIYVNGEVQGTGATRPSGLNNTATVVSIGSKRTSNDPTYDGTFNGTIDEVAVYAQALTPAAIQAHYAAAYGPSLAPFITLQPSSLTNYASLPAIFSVGAAGTVPLSYQWYKQGVGAIAGATDSAYTNSSLALTDAGSYYVTVTNSIGQTNSGFAQLTVLAAPTAAVSIPGLVLHLPFDNNLTDATGRGNNGTGIHISGTASNVAAPSFVAGQIGQALAYSTDTNGPNNSYVTLGVLPDLQFSSNVNFSVSYWIQLPVNYVGNDLPFFTDTPGSTFGPGFLFAPTFGSAGTTGNPGGWALSIFNGANSGAGLGVYGDTGSINDGNWHHLLHVIDRVAGMVTYLDGVPAHYAKQPNSTSIAAAGNIDNGQPATIGQDPTGVYAQPGSANIDDLGVWRRTLTPLEAASVYIAGVNHLSFTGPPPGPPSLTFVPSGNSITITYQGTLLSSTNVTGPYSPVAPTPPNPYTVPNNGAAGPQFFRAVQ